MPFGTVGSGEFGTYFIGYAASSEVIEQMLRNMFVGDPPGNHDRILDFSTPVTGSLFFVPTAEFLEDPAARVVGSATTTGDTTGESSPADGSLGIGSLRRSGTP
jgi:putative iron-dependent peroxidase